MILEIRTYRLRPGTREEFLRAMAEETIPLLLKAGIDVVAAGPSLYAEDGNEEAVLMRAFASLDQLAEQEDAFYASDAWLNGPREAIVGPIEQYHSIALDVPVAVVEGLRKPF
ncbi:NIPSNAP family protein [Catenulispora subtropica]|uniref:NIPSNAP family protein n=1 Tax=Catenulispora subtropica TaxID=450798 RepID=A0ABP5DBT6_9ACTN